ncbi:hypothetical protein EDC01DRAFT_634127 [Geopyxis carbonaria]|nr:hypothetical protein EDC01DRAFT_634127 [Geopyxis carbonaria]
MFSNVDALRTRFERTAAETSRPVSVTPGDPREPPKVAAILEPDPEDPRYKPRPDVPYQQSDEYYKARLSLPGRLAALRLLQTYSKRYAHQPKPDRDAEFREALATGFAALRNPPGPGPHPHIRWIPAPPPQHSKAALARRNKQKILNANKGVADANPPSLPGLDLDYSAQKALMEQRMKQVNTFRNSLFADVLKKTAVETTVSSNLQVRQGQKAIDFSGTALQNDGWESIQAHDEANRQRRMDPRSDEELPAVGYKPYAYQVDLNPEMLYQNAILVGGNQESTLPGRGRGQMKLLQGAQDTRVPSDPGSQHHSSNHNIRHLIGTNRKVPSSIVSPQSNNLFHGAVSNLYETQMKKLGMITLSDGNHVPTHDGQPDMRLLDASLSNEGVSHGSHDRDLSAQDRALIRIRGIQKHPGLMNPRDNVNTRMLHNQGLMTKPFNDLGSLPGFQDHGHAGTNNPVNFGPSIMPRSKHRTINSYDASRSTHSLSTDHDSLTGSSSSRSRGNTTAEDRSRLQFNQAEAELMKLNESGFSKGLASQPRKRGGTTGSAAPSNGSTAASPSGFLRHGSKSSSSAFRLRANTKGSGNTKESSASDYSDADYDSAKEPLRGTDASACISTSPADHSNHRQSKSRFATLFKRNKSKSNSHTPEKSSISTKNSKKNDSSDEDYARRPPQSAYDEFRNGNPWA